MRIALFLSTLLQATPAMAQYQPYQPVQPDLAGGYQRVRHAIAAPRGKAPPRPVGYFSLRDRFPAVTARYL